MPRIPSLFTGLAHRLGRKAVVTEVTQLSPGLVLAGFAGADLRGKAWHPGAAVEFLVTEQEMRHYTPLCFDTVAGSCSILMQTRSPGPGSRWVRQLSPGTHTLIFGPGGRPWLRPGVTQLMLGDTTAVGLFRGLIDALPPETKVLGAVEVPDDDAAAVRQLLPELAVVSRLRDWVRPLAEHPDICYLAGHAQTLNAIRQDLLLGTAHRPPLSRKQIVVQAYWASGKTGL